MSQNHTIESVVEKLVQEHFDLEENLENIVWVKSATPEPEIRLLEINSKTLATDNVMSFYFPPSNEVPYDLYIAEITPTEWQKVLQKEIPLPEDWNLEEVKMFSRKMVAA